MPAVKRAAAPLTWVVLLGMAATGCGAGTPSPTEPVQTRSGYPTPTTASPITAPPMPGAPTPAATPPIEFPPGFYEATSGQFYAETDGGVLRIDLRKRSVDRILTPRFDSFRNFVATRRFLVVKQIDSGIGFVVTSDDRVGDLPVELGGAGRLYAAGRDGIWVVSEDPNARGRVISQFSTATEHPTLLGRRTLPDALGIPGSDNAGNLVAESPEVAYVVTRSATKRLPGWQPEWELLGIGRTSVLVKPCPRCKVILRSRTKPYGSRPAMSRGLRAVDKLISTYDYAADGQLSPNGRYLAMDVTMNNERRDFRLAVVDLVTGATSMIPGTTARANANDQFAWLSRTNDRWLLAVTDQTLRVLDTKTGVVHTWRDAGVDRIAVVG